MLTQAEIDALLEGAIELEGKDGQAGVNLAELMGKEPVEKKAEPVASPTQHHKVQPYNFWSPDRFSKEQMRAVELVHEDLGERLTTTLPSFLRVNLRIRLVHSDQGRFHDFLADISGSTLFHMITLAPLPGRVVVTMSPVLNGIVLNQRLGSKSEAFDPGRELTDIDQALLRGMVEHMLNDIKAAWGKLVTIEPALEDSTTNQHWVQMLMGNERVMLLTFEINFPSVTGSLDFFIPFSMLKPIAGDLNPHVWISGRKELMEDPQSRAAMVQSVSNVRLPVRVFLGETEMSLNELTRLEIGDVLQLNTKVTDQLVVEVVNQNLFKAKIGKTGNHMAVQIISAYNESEKNSME
jgi:flagellar motor switch protein FliM